MEFVRSEPVVIAALLLFRLSGLVLLAPVLGSVEVPMRIRTAVRLRDVMPSL